MKTSWIEIMSFRLRCIDTKTTDVLRRAKTPAWLLEIPWIAKLKKNTLKEPAAVALKEPAAVPLEDLAAPGLSQQELDSDFQSALDDSVGALHSDKVDPGTSTKALRRCSAKRPPPPSSDEVELSDGAVQCNCHSCKFDNLLFVYGFNTRLNLGVKISRYIDNEPEELSLPLSDGGQENADENSVIAKWADGDEHVVAITVGKLRIIQAKGRHQSESQGPLWTATHAVTKCELKFMQHTDRNLLLTLYM
jgi:hypothetical protein